MLCVFYVKYDPCCLPVINILKTNIHNDIQCFPSSVKVVQSQQKKEKFSILAPGNGHVYRFVRERPTVGVPPTPPPGGRERDKYPWVDHRRKR